ncbi:hypothetical protein ABIE26_003940 [Pedobacter africanus]|uniref:Uncharacterized protein n=1 Tax=Pedobacter africanus TaxID=151894 RepID=A0ACC6L179_9SPHI|nr:DUF6266 family protein [Pedobacter africanus]MDR6785241.1 hypothetical protein [Pedobacter africanus]
MGFINGGIDYFLRGRVGNHVGRKVDGDNVLAMRPAASTKAPTQAQLDQRFKFGLMTGWLRRLASVIDVGFKDNNKGLTPRNAAVSYNLANAITGVSPNFTISYEDVLYSKGKLDLPGSPVVAVTTAGKLDYSWLAVNGDTNALPADKMTFVVYNPSKDKFVTLRGGALRSALAYVLQLPPDWGGDIVEAYFSVVSADGKLVSDSYYLGSFVVL